MSRTLVQRIHNPHGYVCACDPDCWCRRTAVGRAVKWWFPARYFGLHHKNRALEEWKLKRLYNSGLEPIETQTAVRFHFIFENGEGRVETATDEEQKEYGGEWGKQVCDRSAFDK